MDNQLLLISLKNLLKAEAEDWDPLEDDADFNPGDHYGNNSDDCFQGGISVGRVHLAKALLDYLESN